MTETMQADRRLRGVTLAAVVVLVIAGAVLLQVLLPQYLDHLRTLSQPIRIACGWNTSARSFGCSALSVRLGAMIGVHTLRLGVRTRRAGKFPPPGVKVIVDTRVLQCRRAQQAALALMIGGALFAVAAVGLHAATRDILGPASPAPMPAPPGERG